MDIKNLTNYLHNKYKEKGKYISKRVIEECINEGINFATHKEDAPNQSQEKTVNNNGRIIESSKLPDNIHKQNKELIDKDYALDGRKVTE